MRPDACKKDAHSFGYGILKVGQPCICGEERWAVSWSLRQRLWYVWWTFRVAFYFAWDPKRYEEEE